MIHETVQQRKNKICLSDYNFKQDIQNRLLMAQFSTLELEVLEEILYSSLKIPIRKMSKTLDIPEEKLFLILDNLSKTGLFTKSEEYILIDKEMRKYFETQMIKFDPDFKPGMEFLQSLLKKVPISVLPAWYSIPRTSNNIFDSIVEKYLLSPQIFHRYLSEVHFTHPIEQAIMQDLYNSPEFMLFADEIIEKYSLSSELFEEHILNLEFHLICCLGYRKINDQWREIITPYQEWREYLFFLRNTHTLSIARVEEIVRKRPQDFSFIQDMTAVLQFAKKNPFRLNKDKDGYFILSHEISSLIAEKLEGLSTQDSFFKKYTHRLFVKLCLLKLADVIDGRLYALEAANDWFDMRIDNRALFLYRHPLNRLICDTLPAELCTERHVREAEKSISRVLTSGWVYFDDFIRGVITPLSERSIVMLKKQGKMWKYTLPTYTDNELALIKATVLEWLFESGVTAVGVHKSKECFCVTPFGQSLFGR